MLLTASLTGILNLQLKADIKSFCVSIDLFLVHCGQNELEILLSIVVIVVIVDFLTKHATLAKRWINMKDECITEFQ